MSRRKPKVFRLKPGVYPHTIVFYIGEKPDWYDMGTLCERYGLTEDASNLPEPGEHSWGFVVHFTHGCFVWLSPYVNEPAWFGTLVHETVHILANLSKATGIEAGGEAHAYYAGWIVNEVMRRVLR